MRSMKPLVSFAALGSMMLLIGCEPTTAIGGGCRVYAEARQDFPFEAAQAAAGTGAEALVTWNAALDAGMAAGCPISGL